MQNYIEQFKNLFFQYKKVIVLVSCIIIPFILFILIQNKFNFSNSSELLPQIEFSENTITNTVATKEDQYNKKIVVDVKGEVNKPGVYTVEETMRIGEVIMLAGGFTNNANQKDVNLAQIISDEMIIYIPSLDENNQENSITSTSKININTATKEALLSIEGIGDKKAEAIINFRNKVKRIKSFEELKEIKGFSQKIIDKLKEQCRL